MPRPLTMPASTPGKLFAASPSRHSSATPNTASAMHAQSMRCVRSPSIRQPSTATYAGAVYCRKTAFAAVVRSVEITKNETVTTYAAAP